MLTSLAAVVVVPLLLILWTGRGRLRHSPWPAAIVIGWYGLQLARFAASNIRAPREWDFACFWLYGHIAAARLNVYDPAVFKAFPSPFMPSDEFRAAVLNVGFPYPPPTIALFYPLAFIHGVAAELAVWYVVQFAALVAAAWLLSRTFFPTAGWPAACLVLALIVALPATLMNVNDAQTNFLVLLLIALALRGRQTAGGAVWQMLAIWIKPYAAALFLLDIIHGRGRRLLVAAATAVVSIGLAAIVLGPATLSAYLRANPSAREPAFAFVESVNQSLLAVVLRLHGALPAHISALHEPLYLAAAIGLTIVTVGLCARTRRDDAVAFSAFLLLGLIVYPGSLSSYGVALIVPLLVLWTRRANLPGGGSTVAAIVALAVLLQNGRFQHGFVANVIVWIACLYLLAVERRQIITEAGPPARVAAMRSVEVVS